MYDYKQIGRIYAAHIIIDVLGEVPSSAKRVPLLGFLEKKIGEFYIVSEADMDRIEGSLTPRVIHAALHEARRAQQRISYDRDTGRDS